MGEAQNQPFQLSFNPMLKVDFQGSRVTSDGGLILVRELDERLGFSDLIAQHLTDPRGTNTQFPLADLVRQSVYRRLAGYEDVNDAERLSQDPTFRLIGSEQTWERGAALTSRVHSFETELLTQDENLAGLAAINRELIAQGGTRGHPAAGGARSRLVPRSPSTASRSRAPTTATSSRPAIIRCCCSIGRATVWRRSCGRATSTAPRSGTRCCCPRSSGSSGRARTWSSGPMPALPSRRSTKPWRSGTQSTPFASPRTTPWSGPSRSCSRGRSGDPVTSRWSGTRASGTKPRVGRSRGEWWRRSSSTAGNCSLEWASS